MAAVRPTLRESLVNGAPGMTRLREHARLLGLGLLFLAWGSPAAFAQSASPSIEVRGDCVDAAAVAASVAERVGASAEVSAVITCGEEVAIDIDIRTATIAETRRLLLTAEDFGHVGHAIALVVLVALEPERSTEDEPGDQRIAPATEPRSSESPSVSEPPEPESSEAATAPGPSFASWEVFAGALASAGDTRDWLAGLSVGLAYRFDPTWSLVLDGRVWMPRTVLFTPHGRIDLTPVGGRLAVCAQGVVPELMGMLPEATTMTVEAGACPAFILGATGAHASEFEGDNLERWELRAALSIRAPLTVVWDAFLVRIEAELGVNLVAPAFFVLVDGVSRVFAQHVGPLWVGLGFFLGARWPG